MSVQAPRLGEPGAAAKAQHRADAPRLDEVVRRVPLPNGRARQRHYDLLGRVTYEKDPDGRRVRYRYHSTGRLAEIRQEAGPPVEQPSVTYEMDEARRELVARFGPVTTAMRLASDGSVAESRTTIDGHCWTVGYRWDEAGRLSGLRYPQAAGWLALRHEADDGLALAAGAHEYCRLWREAATQRTYLDFANGAWTCEETEIGRARRVGRVTCGTASQAAVVDVGLAYDERGRLARVGAYRAAYDEGGRLVRLAREGDAQPFTFTYAFTYDAQGRLLARSDAHRQVVYGYEDGGDEADGPPIRRATDDRGHVLRFEADPVGRRTARHGPEGCTAYAYNLLGLLAQVDLPDGSTIRYLYDGFGRLVGRVYNGVPTYYILDLDGRRLAEADDQGEIVCSYLWIGGTCVGRIDGRPGDALACSFHRSYGNRLAAVGDAAGNLAPVGDAPLGGDPFGSDSPIVGRVPGFAGLFGDPATGLLYAGSRWYDPALAQFITPDSWFGDEIGRRMIDPVFRSLDHTPGWTTRPLTPAGAYAWCNGDPLNYSDPSGHNWFGLIFTTLSAFFWEMQLTSVSLQMHVINFVLDTIQVVPVFRPIWDTQGYFRNSVYNIAWPVASYRLMVPFALILNGLLNVQDVCWTLGSVIWARGTELRRLASLSKRELLICANAQDYLAATNVAAAEPRRFRARNPQAQANGTVDATGNQVNGLTVVAPIGGALADLLQADDWVAVKLPGGASDELRQVIGTGGGAIGLDRPLPAAYQNQAAEVTRLDQPLVKMVQGSKQAARFISFVRGSALHFGKQLPEGFPTERLQVSEHLTAGQARRRVADFPPERVLLRMAKAADVAGYAANDFVRVSGGSASTARQIVRGIGATDLLLDRELPAGMVRLDVVRMTPSGAVAAAQTANGDRVTCGPMVDLKPQDGLAIENTGAPTVTTERRIVKQILLDCQVDPLPAPLHLIAVKVDIVTPDATKTANGTVDAALEITTDAGQATRFSAEQPVQIATAGGKLAYSVVDSVDGATNKITLVEPLPAADFPATTAVTVTLLKASNSYDADNVAAPGNHVLVQTPFGNTLAANTVIRVRPAPDRAGGSVRVIQAAPTVVAQVDAVLPGSHTANLSVQRFVPDVGSQRKGVRAPAVRWRLRTFAPAHPYAVGDELMIDGDEEAVGTVFAVSGADLILQEPLELAFRPVVTVYGFTPTGKSTANAKLDEGLVMVPSDPKVMLTRREALEQHEMRHVLQGAKFGPFLLSLPIPWLFHMGYAFGEKAHQKSSLWRHIGLGGLDSLFARIAWGIGGSEGPTELAGILSDSARKTVTFAEGTDAAKLAKFTPDSRLEVNKSGKEPFFNVVEQLDEAARQVIMRFPMDEEHFSQNDEVRISVSPFEEMRKFVNTWFSLNLEQLWADHLPESWMRALSKLLNRDGWFPMIGIYPLAWIFAWGDRDRIPAEQDASYHSGDLYNTIVLGRPNRMFVGQFSRIFAFIHTRSGTSDAAGLAKNTWGSLLEILTVDLPPGGTAADVAGAIPASAPNEVRFRENYYIPLQDRVENAVGVFFNPLKPGTYTLKAPGTLDKDLVFKFLFDVSFSELSTIEVLDIPITPDPAQPVFETDEITFVPRGDKRATYAIRFAAGPGPNLGVLNGMRYSVPVLAGGAATATQNFEMTATYPANAPVFRGEGQLNRMDLTADQLTNLVKTFTLTIDALPVRAIGPVKEDKTEDFEMPFEPVRINVGAPPADATGTATVRVLNPGKRPAKLQFRAPAKVPTAGDITVDLIYGANPANRRTVTMTVHVEPT